MGILSELTTLHAHEPTANYTAAMRAALERYAAGTHDKAPGAFNSFINPSS